MDHKRRLRERWAVEPGSSIRRRVIAFLDPLQIGHARKSEELFALLEGLPFRDEVASGRDFRGSDFGEGRELDFSAADFSFSTRLGRFFDCDLTHSRFDEVTAERISFGNVVCGASFRKANLRSCYFMGVQARDCRFDDAKLLGTNFKNSDLTGSSFRNANCKGACFYKTNLTGCDFRGAILDEAVFQGATLDKTTDFRGASLINAYYKEHRDNAGNFLAAGVNLRAATCDETTKLGDDPTAFPLEILERAIEIAKGQGGSVPAKILSLLREAMRAIRAGHAEHWEEEILAQLDERERAAYDELMDQTFESLR